MVFVWILKQMKRSYRVLSILSILSYGWSFWWFESYESYELWSSGFRFEFLWIHRVDPIRIPVDPPGHERSDGSTSRRRVGSLKAWKNMENAWRCNMISPEKQWVSFFPGWGQIIDVDHQAEASRRAEAPSRWTYLGHHQRRGDHLRMMCAVCVWRNDVCLHRTYTDIQINM